MSNRYLIYQVHGKKVFFYEALYSLLSFYKFNSDTNIQIAIYTDDIPFFENYFGNKILYISINDQKIKDWRGKIDFVHRVKIEIIQDFTNNYSGNFLYLDTDTCFETSINSLFDSIEKGALYLDKYECELFESKSGIKKPIAKFFRTNNNLISSSDKQPIKVNPPFELWNAGVIGFNEKYKNILPKVTSLTDLLYPKLKSHITEQFAFCYYFQKEKKPLETVNFIEHYWYFKEFQTVLKDFFDYHKNKSVPELLPEIHKINPLKLSQEKRDYKKMKFFQKIIQKLSKGKKWEIIPYKL